MDVRKLVLITGFSIFWSGCASINKSSSLEHWKTFNSASAAPQANNVVPDHALAVFIRERNAFAGPAANIFIEGEYFASLQPGGYKAVSLCANPTRMSAAYTQSELNYLDVRQIGKEQSLSAGKIHYFKLATDTNQAIQIQAITEEQAQKILPTVQEQVHTLPRMEKNRVCAKPVYIQVPVPAVLKKYTLQANTLFAYAKSGPNDILQKGREEVAAIAAEISHDQDRINHITVIGYTDPVGSEVFNQQLSLHRAETVRELLIAHGVAKQNILVEGRGEQDLVVNNCQDKYAKNKMARTQCDLPNRRVEIITYGMKAE